MKHKNLAKRITAVLLSASMVFGSSGMSTLAADDIFMDDPNDITVTSYAEDGESEAFGEEIILDLNDIENVEEPDEEDEDTFEFNGDGWEEFGNAEEFEKEADLEDEEFSIAENPDPVSEETTATGTALVTFQLESGIIIATETIEKELSNEESYQFTQADINAVLPEGYELVQVLALPEKSDSETAEHEKQNLDSEAEVIEDLNEENEDLTQIPNAIVGAGDTIEITVIVAEKTITLTTNSGIINNSLKALSAGNAAGSQNGSQALRTLVANREAEVFFDATNENPSFDSVDYWDTYDRNPNANQFNYANGLFLDSSTDGAATTHNGYALRIDFETGSDISHPLGKTTSDYSNGNYTIVGWGGNFNTKPENNATVPDKSLDTLYFTIESGTSGKSADDIAKLFTIELYDKDGKALMTASHAGHLKAGTTAFSESNGTYFLNITAANKQKIQGIKVKFNNPQGDFSQGTVFFKEVYFKAGNDNVAFDPFKSEYNVVYNDYGPQRFWFTYIDPRNRELYPYIRLANDTEPVNGQDGNRGAKWGGRNIANKHDTDYPKYAWHTWTMSTSDANIVRGNDSTKNTDALQIKYNNDNGHKTWTYLEAKQNSPKGEWLAINVYAPNVDADKLKVKLNDGTTYALTEFVTDMSNPSLKVQNDTLKNGYQTIYLKVKGDANTSYFNLKKVEFVFDDVASSDAEQFMYVNSIYLLKPTAKIEKEVKVASAGFTKDNTQADAGNTLTYKIIVKNDGSVPIYAGEAIDIKVPDGLENINAISDDGTFDGTSRVIKWTGITLAAKGAANDADKKEFTFSAKIPDDTANATYVNQAKITSLNNIPTDKDDGKIWSNTVTTTVVTKTEDKYIFYAEVGQKTSLPITLGRSLVTSSSTVTTETNYTDTSITVNANKDANDYAIANSNSGTISIPSDSADGKVKYAVRLTTIGDVSGGFVFNNIVIGSKTYTLKQSNRDAGEFKEGTYEGGSIEGIKYHSNAGVQIGADRAYDGRETSFSDGLSDFDSGKAYIEFASVPRGENLNVTINIAQAYENRTYKLEVIKLEEITSTTGTIQKDTFASAGASNFGAEIDLGTARGGNSGSISYKNTSVQTGRDEFVVTVNKGGVSTDTKQVTIYVYNYKVDNLVYVLDYGLPVDLANGVQGILKNGKNVLKHSNDGTTAAIRGIATDRVNTDNVADSADYYSPSTDEETVYYGQRPNASAVATIEKTYGNAEFDGSTIKYSPTHFMSDVDSFYYGVQVNVDGTRSNFDARNSTPVMEGQIKVMPASIVYYEDNFASSGKDADGTNGIRFVTSAANITTDGTSVENRYQSNDQSEQYGHDNEYSQDNKNSGGSSTVMTGGDKAIFKFKGTGFELVSRTNENTGSILVNVYDAKKVKIDSDQQVKYVDDTETNTATIRTAVKKSIILNTYYENGDLYQIPIISVQDLKYGEYLVEIRILETTRQTVYLDGIRIFNPLGTGEDVASDIQKSYGAEYGATLKEVKSMILGEGYTYDSQNKEKPLTAGKEPEASLVKYDDDEVDAYFMTGTTVTENFTGAYYGGEVSKDMDITSEMASYAIQGPNNELYLSDGYGIGFIVTKDTTVADKDRILQIGMKAVTAEAPRIQYLKDETYEDLLDGGVLSTSTEMFYPVEYNGDGQPIIIRATGEGILSLTKLKVRGYKIGPVNTGSEASGEQPQKKPSLIPDASKVKTVYYSGGTARKKLAGTVSVLITGISDDAVAAEVYAVNPDTDGSARKLELLGASKNKKGWKVQFLTPSSTPQEYYVLFRDEMGNYSDVITIG